MPRDRQSEITVDPMGRRIFLRKLPLFGVALMTLGVAACSGEPPPDDWPPKRHLHPRRRQHGR